MFGNKIRLVKTPTQFRRAKCVAPNCICEFELKAVLDVLEGHGYFVGMSTEELGIAILVLKVVAEQKASKFVRDYKDEYIRAIGSKISNESVKQVYDSEIKKASDAWEVRECQKSANLTAQVNQAKTRCTTASTHTESTQNSMDVF